MAGGGSDGGIMSELLFNSPVRLRIQVTQEGSGMLQLTIIAEPKKGELDYDSAILAVGILGVAFKAAGISVREFVSRVPGTLHEFRVDMISFRVPRTDWPAMLLSLVGKTAPE